MASSTVRPRGAVLRGRVWPGGDEPGWSDGVVVLDSVGVVAAMGPATEVALPDDLPARGGPGCWVGLGITDAHVHLAFGAPEAATAASVVAVRDLGAPLQRALGWRTRLADGPPSGQPWVTVAGPLLTAPGGYPASSWGADGFALFVGDPAAGSRAVDALVDAGVDVVKIALEPAGGAPVLDLATVHAVVDRAHVRGRRVTAHALTVAMVERALDAGVDEFCHTPTEPLPDVIVVRLAATEVPVVSTLATLCRTADRDVVLDNARRLVTAGVSMIYGTDLGNAGTQPGVDPDELALLAATGLGDQGAVRAATTGAAALVGVSGYAGAIRVGHPLTGVVLPADPLVDATCWRRPLAVFVGGQLRE